MSTIAVALTSATAAKTLITSGALSELTKRHRVVGILAPSVPQSLKINFPTIAMTANSAPYKASFNFHIWNIALFASLRAQKIKTESSFKAAQLPPLHQAVYQALSAPYLYPMIKALDRNVLFRSNESIEALLRSEEIDLVITPGSALDTYSFQFTRAAARLGKPSAMIITHWDYFTKKGLLRENPNKVYVWGEDMRLSAERSLTTRTGQLEIVGAPQFDIYRSPAVEAGRAFRKQIGVADDEILLLFAGTGAPFDEARVILDILELCGERSEKLRILYRRHPKGWVRKSSVKLDSVNSERLLIDDSEQTAPEHFIRLLNGIDGVVSPFSTMILEAALCGKPSLCIAFGDNLNDWDFSLASNNDHLKLIRSRTWTDVCEDRGTLGFKFDSFIERIQQKDLASIRTEAERTVLFGETSYAQRLANQLERDFGLIPREAGGCILA